MTFDTSTTTTTNTHMDAFTSDALPKVSPDVIEWVRVQKEAGETPETLFDKLVEVNWDPVLARQIVGLPALPVSDAPAVAPALSTPQPGPDLSNMPGSIDLGDCRAHVLLSMELPRVALFANVLSDYECEALIAYAQKRGLARSKTISNTEDAEQVDPIRTSEGVYFQRGESELIQRLETRISRLLNWPVDHGEGIQVLHYGGGNQYEPHYDYFQPKSPATPRHLKHGGQRVGTLIMYLADTETGGATVFPESKLSILPRRGNALFFGYERPETSTLTLHGGAPVVAGEKWIATKWLRERENV